MCSRVAGESSKLQNGNLPLGILTPHPSQTNPRFGLSGDAQFMPQMPFKVCGVFLPKEPCFRQYLSFPCGSLHASRALTELQHILEHKPLLRTPLTQLGSPTPALPGHQSLGTPVPTTPAWHCHPATAGAGDLPLPGTKERDSSTWKQGRSGFPGCFLPMATKWFPLVFPSYFQ